MACKRKILSLVVDAGGNIRLSGNSAISSVPAKTVTLEPDIPICTYNQWKGNFYKLPEKVQQFVADYVQKCKPIRLYICDGSQAEADEIIHKLEESGVLDKLTKYENNYICRTDSTDVSSVDTTWICTKDKYQTVPHVAPGVQGILGRWCSPEDGENYLKNFEGCMAGRTLYVIPFSMGPIGSPLSKIGVELTDSNYVILCMRIMARVSPEVWSTLGDGDFVKCVHSLGSPMPRERTTNNGWPCNPEKAFIIHFPERKEICSFGSGYAGNSLLGKKSYALNSASNMAREEGWLAENMLIMGVKNLKTKIETFIAAAFPPACGKTTMAMLESTHPDFQITFVGDDIAWMRFDNNGDLYAINPEAGSFGLCPGINANTNPIAMKAFEKNSIFTNIATTQDGGFYWEGLEDEVDKNIAITSWLNQPFRVGDIGKAAHPNSRFCCPASQIPTIHPKWDDKKGVKIEAVIFGGRRPLGVPLVFETFSWSHGVMVGACVKSEETAAGTVKKTMHDPMAMKPYMEDTAMKFEQHVQFRFNTCSKLIQVPKIFHVNWFRTDKEGIDLWPGFGENIRVIDWILRRVKGDESIGITSPIGYLPKKGSINLNGLGEIKWDELMSLPKQYWENDAQENKNFLQQQVGEDCPKKVMEELDEQEKRINGTVS